MTLEDMRSNKKTLGLSNTEIAEATGIPIGTVQKIFSGETENPRYQTVRLLSELFDQREQERKRAGRGHEPQCVRESLPAYGSSREEKIGPYRLQDYYALPADKRKELIDGYYYDMASPGTRHQEIAGEVFYQIVRYIRDNNGKCHPFIAPCDVQLDQDDKTMVQPDVMVVCDPSKITDQCIVGAPDFVLEVLSPGTARKDATLKLRKYEQAGVREYWLVEPVQKYVIIYTRKDGEGFDFPMIHPMKGKIPVGIYDGRLLIDFDQMDTLTSEAGKN